jgi:hypothetical protein
VELEDDHARLGPEARPATANKPSISLATPDGFLFDGLDLGSALRFLGAPAMIADDHPLRVYARTTPTDMRKSFDTLAALVTQEMGRDPLSGDVYLFVDQACRVPKVLFWDGSGLVVMHKRISTAPGPSASRTRTTGPPSADTCSRQRRHRPRRPARSSTTSESCS